MPACKQAWVWLPFTGVAKDEVEHSKVLAAEHIAMAALPVRVAVQYRRRRRTADPSILGFSREGIVVPATSKVRRMANEELKMHAGWGTGKSHRET